MTQKRIDLCNSFNFPWIAEKNKNFSQTSINSITSKKLACILESRNGRTLMQWFHNEAESIKCNTLFYESGLSDSQRTEVLEICYHNQQELFKIIQFDFSLSNKCNSFEQSKQPTSSWIIIKTTLSYIYAYYPAVKKSKALTLLECGIGSGRAVYGFIHYSQKEIKVAGADILKNDIFTSIALFEEYEIIQNNKYIENYVCYEKNLEEIQSGGSFDVIYAKSRSCSKKFYSAIINSFNNSKAKILVISYNKNWKFVGIGNLL